MSAQFIALATVLLVSAAHAADHVIVISVDGLRSEAIDIIINDDDGPNFERLQQEGVWTHDARTDYHYTRTIPNNVSIVTGRPVLLGEIEGHGWSKNSDPSPSDTLHNNKGSYVSSMFDISHDHGLRTSFHVGKEKLELIDESYDSSDGAFDQTGSDDGRRKIDVTVIEEGNAQAADLVNKFIEDLLDAPIHLAFIHLIDPDKAGHGDRWETDGYYDAVERVDTYLGQILQAIENNAPYTGNTTIILTADHGGDDISHADPDDRDNYEIPFYVWGTDVPAQGDLYSLNATTRVDPNNGRPPFALTNQPIRNGDTANLALDLLSLPPIPGSAINASQDLAVALLLDTNITISFNSNRQPVLNWAPGIPATVQISAPSMNNWQDAPSGTWPSTDGIWTDTASNIPRRFYRVSFD